MPLYAVLSADGLCEGVLTMDEPSAAVHPLQAGEQLVPISRTESGVLKHLGHHAIRHNERWAVLPESYARKIERSRGIPAMAAYAHTARRRDLRDVLDSTGALADYPMVELANDDPILPQPGPTPWPGLLRPFQQIVIRDGLLVRHMVEADITPLSQIMFSTGAYDGLTLQECWNMAHDWWRDPTVWAMALDWRGQVLQYEMFHFDDKRNTARGGFVTHVSRERPAWFWRECAKPVFQALQGYGYTKMSGHVRSDRKDWADSLTETYGAENLGLLNGFWTLRYDLDRMIAQATGWRVPETAGAGWEATDRASGLLEASPAEMVPALERMREAWHGRPRGVYAERMLRERLELDAGTLLLGVVNGALSSVWVMRWKAPGVLNWALGTPWDPSEDMGRLYRLVTLWCHAAGFQTLETMFPEANWTHSGMTTQRARMGWIETRRVTTDGGTFVVATADVAALLARPDAAWTATG